MNSTGKSFIKQLPANIFSGFVVSLIALPLGLGLSLASEAPPIAGIIAAIVGGTVVAVFGGSHLTITGPGNGLVIVLLGAITTLGAGDLYQGYLFTLAAIVLSGVLLFLFGLFRLGALSEFFPASALQGMLAAIGLGIFAKQFHVMLGITSVNGDTVRQMLMIPNSVQQLFQSFTFDNAYAAIIGVASLVFLFVYNKIRNPIFHLIPAPMWVVVATVGLGYYYLLVLRQPAPIDAELLIQIPDNLIANLPRPDFSLLFEPKFIAVVFSITLIASIESLLSIKAVDKLDPEKRRSNVNKDLRALGLASVASGFLGGLNVVTVIARSSVNANNGGSNRSANFFHALFLVFFLLVFARQMQLIPLTALAAILVFTGYKLAAPENLIRIYKIGPEQALIFLTTLTATLLTNLISGIGIGILATFLVHVFLNHSLVLFTRNLFKPNVLMYKEAATGNYYVSVKNFCSFLNFFKLKLKLDQIPEDQHAIVDFSLCDFVDHTVMEDINDYQRSFSLKGGVFEVIGLDIHTAETQHPFAVRKSIPFNKILNFKRSLTKRQLRLQELAKTLDWSYSPDLITKTDKQLHSFLFFNSRIVNYRYNTLKSPDAAFKMFDVSYSEGAFITKEDLKSSFLLVKSPIELPSFVLDKENFRHTIYQLAGLRDIDFKKYPDFSKHFYLNGDNPKAIRALFDKQLIFFFESHPYYQLESNGAYLLVKNRDRLSSIQELKAMMAYTHELLALLEKVAGKS